MANPFDQFDAQPSAAPGGFDAGTVASFKSGPDQQAQGGNPFDQFDGAPSIDFNRPIEAVRGDIAKLKGQERADALKQWSEHYVARERQQGGVGEMADNTVRTLARGTFAGPFLDEATAASQAAQHAVGLGGAPYDEALAYQRARDSAIDTDYPVASFAGKVAGGIAGGVAALPVEGVSAAAQGGSMLARGVQGAQVATGGPLAAVAPAATLMGRTAQGIGVGGAYGAASGFGNAEGGEGSTLDQAGNRLVGAAEGGAIGAATGGVMVPAIEGVIGAAGKVGDAGSVAYAKYSQQLKNLLREIGVLAEERPPTSAGAMANPTPPAPTTGAEAAAEQTIANQLARANVDVATLRQRLAEAERATQLGPNSRAQNALAPVDLDPSLQRLASSVGRQQPEAGNIAEHFIVGRQTGMTPPSGPLPPEAGIPTRPTLSKPEADAPPMGQFERTRDALRRAMGIADDASHGHAPTAYQQDQAIVQKARDEAKTLYAAANKAAEATDLQPTIKPVMESWIEKAKDQQIAIAKQIRTALKQFRTGRGPINTLDQFDKAKQALDDEIDKAFRAGDRQRGGLLTQIKNDLVDAVDGVKDNGVGAAYQKARDAFSSNMQMRDALALGQQLFKENSDVAIDQFKALATEGERKLARLGIVDSFVNQMSRQKRTADVTQAFQNPRIQEIIETMIPRSKGKAAEFADRPERFGRFLDSEGRMMMGTRNEVLGNSKTAQRAKDDEALNEMMGFVENLRKTTSAQGAAMRFVAGALDRMFGFQADTAAAVARKLFTASRDERDRTLQAVAARLGPSRTAQLSRLMAEHEARLSGATGTAAGNATAPKGGEPAAPDQAASAPPAPMKLGGPTEDQPEEPPHHATRQPRSDDGRFEPGKPKAYREPVSVGRAPTLAELGMSDSPEARRRDSVDRLAKSWDRPTAMEQPPSHGVAKDIYDAVATYARAVKMATQGDSGEMSDSDMSRPAPMGRDEINRAGGTLAGLAMTGARGGSAALADVGDLGAGSAGRLQVRYFKTEPGVMARVEQGLKNKESPQQVVDDLNSNFNGNGRVSKVKLSQWAGEFFPEYKDGFGKQGWSERTPGADRDTIRGSSEAMTSRKSFADTMAKLWDTGAPVEKYMEAFGWTKGSAMTLRAKYAKDLELPPPSYGDESQKVIREMIGKGATALEIANAIGLKQPPNVAAKVVNIMAKRMGLEPAPTKRGMIADRSGRNQAERNISERSNAAPND